MACAFVRLQQIGVLRMAVYSQTTNDIVVCVTIIVTISEQIAKMVDAYVLLHSDLVELTTAAIKMKIVWMVDAFVVHRQNHPLRQLAMVIVIPLIPNLQAISSSNRSKNGIAK